MKVYLVVSAQGFYEDRSERIERAYTDEAKAINFMEKYNKKLNRDQARYRDMRERGFIMLYEDYRVEEKHEARIDTIDVEE